MFNGERHFVPSAVLDRPVSFFERERGYHFEHDSDDLDEFDVAGLLLNDGHWLALMHRPGNPEGTVTVLLPRSDPHGAHVLDDLLRALEVPSSTMIWKIESQKALPYYREPRGSPCGTL